MDQKELEQIREAWKKEDDGYLLKASTTDIENYPEEVQQIIIDEVKQRGLENVHYEGPLTPKEHIVSFFSVEILLCYFGMLGGLIMMIGASIWFFIGLFFGLLFWYPAVLFLFGIIAFLIGLFTKNFAGEKYGIYDKTLNESEQDEGEDIIYNKNKPKKT